MNVSSISLHVSRVLRRIGRSIRDINLTNLPLDKMPAILADDIFKCIFLNENDKIPNQISLKFVRRSHINSICSYNGMVPTRRWLFYWHIYASLGLDELTDWGRGNHHNADVIFKSIWCIFKLILLNGGWDISDEIEPRWIPLNLTDDKSILVQVMVWCRQATSHYLSQCWPRSLSPYGVTRPQWVKGKTWTYTWTSNHNWLITISC